MNAVTDELIERCYVYRFFDAEDRLLYVGIARDLGVRFAAHRRRSPWWADAVRGTTVTYPTRADAELAEGIAIHAEHPLHNSSRPTEAKIARLEEAATKSTDATQLVAEIERLRTLCGDQMIRLVKMQGDLDDARDAHARMRARWLQTETDRAGIARKYFLVTNPGREPVTLPELPSIGLGEW